MNDQKLRIYNAISSFVQDLNVGFGKKYKPLALYNRLIEKTSLRDTNSIERHISAFQNLYDTSETFITKNTLPLTAKIQYSERVYIDIGKILQKSDVETATCINKHLITIYSLMNIGTDKGEQALNTLKNSQTDDKLDLNLPDTNEGQFIKNTLTEMTEQFNNIGPDANPMQMMATMMQSGFFTKFMGDLQSKFSSGEMDIRSLMGTVSSVIGDVTPEGTPEGDQLKNLLDQTMNKVSGGDTTEQSMPDMSGLLNILGNMH